MSQNTQAVLPDPVAAYQHLFNNVHAQVFFGRLGSRGYAPQNEKQAQDLLALAGRLRAVADSEKVAVDESPYGQVVDAIDGLLGNTGVGGQTKAATAREEEWAVKEAATELMQDPTIFNCVLALKAQEAAVIAQQFNR